MGKLQQYVGEKQKDTIEVRVYTGANAKFTLYEDEGDNYNYEKGKYTTIQFSWNEAKKTLSIGNLEGDYKGMLKKRVFNIVWVNENNGIGLASSISSRVVGYDSKQVSIAR